MSKKKIFLSIICILLISAISVVGVWAYLKASTGKLTNTFVKGSGLGPSNVLTLWENEGKQETDGSYSLTTTKINAGSGNTYNVTPNTTIKKNPTVTLTSRTDIPAWLYIEVKNSLPTGMSCTINSQWVQLKNASNAAVTGPNGGTVYVLGSANTAAKTGNYEILTNNQVTVGSIDMNSVLSTNKTLEIHAYLIQASGRTAFAAWDAEY